VRATIPTGWHLYGLSEPPGGPIATSIAVGPPSLARIAGPVAADEPVSAPDPNFGLTTSTYADSARFTVPIAFDSLVHGKNLLAVRVGYQTCNARYCLPPREDVIGVDLRVEGTVASSGTNSATVPPIAVASPSPLPGQSASGTENRLLFLWLAATMGALSLLTPCVFPMVPITISYFSTHERGSRRRAAADAAIYAIGIVGAFTGLGLGMSVVFGTAALSRFAANPWLNLAVAALFVSFALSLFGVVDLALPAGLVNRVERLSRQDRYGRVGTTLLIGATFAVTSFTCTAPLVGTLLVSATQGDWRWPAIGLFVFSCVFALPFLILALVPRALNRLPRSGSWMVALKGTLAFIELGAAMKFLSNADMVSGWGVFTRGVVLAIWAALAVGLALYLAGLRVRNHRVSFATTRYRLGALTAVVAGAWLASGIGGRRLGEAEAFLPPAGAGSSGIVRSRELPWRIDDYDAALAEARASGRLLLVDFTGYTCTNCRWMEANMFPREDVRRALDRFVRVRLFTDGRTDRDREQQIFEQKQFNTVALPLYAVVDPTGRPQRTFLGMTRDTDEFVRFLAGTPKPN
jgi:thiol:disulfide interchange protein DsbD